MDFSKIPLATGSATALLGLCLLLVLLGKLVPRSTLDDARKDAEQIRKDRDVLLADKQREVEMWRTAFVSEVSNTRELTGQVSQLLEVARTADQVFRSISPAGNGDSPNDGSSSGVVSRS